MDTTDHAALFKKIYPAGAIKNKRFAFITADTFDKIRTPSAISYDYRKEFNIQFKNGAEWEDFKAFNRNAIINDVDDSESPWVDVGFSLWLLCELMNEEQVVSMCLSATRVSLYNAGIHHSISNRYHLVTANMAAMAAMESGETSKQREAAQYAHDAIETAVFTVSTWEARKPITGVEPDHSPVEAIRGAMNVVSSLGMEKVDGAWGYDAAVDGELTILKSFFLEKAAGLLRLTNG